MVKEYSFMGFLYNNPSYNLFPVSVFELDAVFSVSWRLVLLTYGLKIRKKLGMLTCENYGGLMKTSKSVHSDCGAFSIFILYFFCSSNR